MVTPLAVRGVSELIYDYQLSSSYKSPWVYDPSFALKQEPDIWEVVRNDVVFASAIQRRTQSIVRPWRVVPNRFAVVKGQDPKQADDSKRVASICHEGLSRIDRFDPAQPPRRWIFRRPNVRRDPVARGLLLARRHGPDALASPDETPRYRSPPNPLGARMGSERRRHDAQDRDPSRNVQHRYFRMGTNLGRSTTQHDRVHLRRHRISHRSW